MFYPYQYKLFQKYLTRPYAPDITHNDKIAQIPVRYNLLYLIDLMADMLGLGAIANWSLVDSRSCGSCRNNWSSSFCLTAAAAGWVISCLFLSAALGWLLLVSLPLIAKEHGVAKLDQVLHVGEKAAARPLVAVVHIRGVAQTVRRVSECKNKIRNIN